MSKHRRPLSQRKLDSCRENGRKSKGPVTSEGKARSSRNAFKHGYAAELRLSVENPEETNLIDAMYRDHIRPASPMELLHVQTMIAAHVRLLRLRRDERDLLELRLASNQEAESRFINLDGDLRRALSFGVEAEHKALNLIVRYEPRLLRAYRTAWRDLAELRPDLQPPGGLRAPRHRVKRPQPETKNEPNPAQSTQSNPYLAVAALMIICVWSLFTATNPALKFAAKSIPSVELNGFTINDLTPVSPA